MTAPSPLPSPSGLTRGPDLPPLVRQDSLAAVSATRFAQRQIQPPILGSSPRMTVTVEGFSQ